MRTQLKDNEDHCYAPYSYIGLSDSEVRVGTLLMRVVCALSRWMLVP